MSIPPLPRGLGRSDLVRIANGLHSAAVHLLRRARTVDRHLGLTAERLSVLSVLVFGGPRTVSHLADAEMVSRPAITRIATALERHGLVRRVRTSRDRRQVVLRATPAGRRLMEEGRKRRVARVAGELRGLDATERAALMKAVTILARLER